MDLALVKLSGTIKILTNPAERMIVHTSCSLRGGEIKRIQFGEILAQRNMGYLGQVTEAFRHLLTSRYLDQQTLSFKMMPRTARHPLGAANLKDEGFGCQTNSSSKSFSLGRSTTFMVGLVMIFIGFGHRNWTDNLQIGTRQAVCR